MQALQRRFQLLTRHARRWRVAIVVLVLGCAGREDVALSADQREVADLQRDMFPLFVLGDVNEDLRIDSVDARLIARLIDSQGKDSTEVSCIAAADVSRDGTVDDHDRTAFGTLLDDARRLAGLPLYSQPYMSCRHTNRWLAAQLESRRGQMVSFRLLRQRVDASFKISVIDSSALVRESADGMGWDVVVAPEGPASALITISILAADNLFSYTLANPAAAQAPATVERWVEAAKTDTNEVGELRDPLVYQPPTIWGEEVTTLEACPQQGAGCEVLVIDFAKSLFPETDADQTKQALESIGCNIVYSTPSFVRIPYPYKVPRRRLDVVEWVEVLPTQESIDRAEATNRAAWLEVRAAIAKHRSNVRSGKELVIQLVNAHGSNGNRYGEWSPGFTARPGSLTRGDFHQGNYHAAHGKACYAVAMDRSCYSGNTPRAIRKLNNTGTANYWEVDFGIDHGFHAAYWSDMGQGSAPAGDICRNGEIFVLDITMGGLIRRNGANGDFNRLVSLGLRPFVLDEAPGKYSDRGYNRRPGTNCQNASHVAAY